MKTPMKTDFEKLFAIIENQDVEKGTYSVDYLYSIFYLFNFKDNTLDTYHIERTVVVRQLHWLGGKNPGLFIAYLLTSICLFILGGVMLFISKKNNESSKLENLT